MLMSFLGKTYYFGEEKGLHQAASENEVQWATNEIRKAICCSTAIICATIGVATCFVLKR